jgi:hypothetical protein
MIASWPWPVAARNSRLALPLMTPAPRISAIVLGAFRGRWSEGARANGKRRSSETSCVENGQGLSGRGARALVGGGVDADGLTAAGRLFADGHDVDRVQIRLSDGTVIEDSTDHPVLLFVADGPVCPPATATLLGRDGHELATHPVLPGEASRYRTAATAPECRFHLQLQHSRVGQRRTLR